MRILTTGSRHWTNVNQIYDTLNIYLDNKLKVAHGDSVGGGSDLFVSDWCEGNDIPEFKYPVIAAVDGKHRAAPLNRSKRMLGAFNPDLVIAFRSSGKSNGTDHTIHNARRMGYPVEVVHELGKGGREC